MVDRPQPSTGRHFVQDRIYEALKTAARKKQAISGAELYEIAYRGCKPASWNAFQKHIADLKKRLKAEGHSAIPGSTVWYRLYDSN
jgi:hypothetical protein